jgi:hypothetical protein
MISRTKSQNVTGKFSVHYCLQCVCIHPSKNMSIKFSHKGIMITAMKISYEYFKSI